MICGHCMLEGERKGRESKKKKLKHLKRKIETLQSAKLQLT